MFKWQSYSAAALGHQLLKSSPSVYLIQLLPRLQTLLLNRMEFAGTTARLFHLFNNCHDGAASQGVGRCSSEEEGIALHAFAFIKKIPQNYYISPYSQNMSRQSYLGWAVLESPAPKN